MTSRLRVRPVDLDGAREHVHCRKEGRAVEVPRDEHLEELVYECLVLSK